MKKSKSKFYKQQTMSLIALVLVGGSLVLAIMDEANRAAFLDLAKVSVAGYIGSLMPKSND